MMREDYAHFPDDARFKELIEEFMQISELFRELCRGLTFRLLQIATNVGLTFGSERWNLNI